MGFFEGLVEGAAGALETGIKEQIENSRKGVRTAKDFWITRRRTAQDRYEGELAKAEEAL